jgi:hypothetical protein
MVLPTGLLTTILYTLLISSTRDKCPTHIIPIYSVNLIISDEWYGL